MNVTSESARNQLIYELGNAFTSRLGLAELIPVVIAKCRDVLNADGVSILLLDETRGELYFPYVSEHDPEVAQKLRGLRFPADRGVAGAVLQTGKGEKVYNPQTDARFYSDVDRKTGVTTKSLLAAPLLTNDVRLGVIEAVNHRDGTPFSDDDLALLEKLAESVAVAIQNARRFGEVEASAEQLRVQVGALRRDLARRDRFNEIIAISPVMGEVFRLMESAAFSSIPVVLEGETGTGKELVARAIHRASARADGPFVAVNCAALPENLLESELFGHRRGAFTGAVEDHPGLFRAAAGGVILLDEIGEMPRAMQAKLLRALQENEVTPIGDTRPIRVDVRVISATNRDLQAALSAHTFREDLYYRLAVFPIRLPPLRERREDIPLLATRFLEIAAERHRKAVPGLAQGVLELLTAAPWPGNVRELQNEMERAAALVTDGEMISMQHLSPGLRMAGAGRPAAIEPSTADSTGQSSNATSAAASTGVTPLAEVRAAAEKQYIAEVLGKHRGNVSRAAVALGVSRVALQKKMKRYGLR